MHALFLNVVNPHFPDATPSKNVGIEAVQQANTSIAHYKTHEAWVVSNRNYTEAARNLASSNNVRLVGREMLINMMLQMNPDKKTS